MLRNGKLRKKSGLKEDEYSRTVTSMVRSFTVSILYEILLLGLI
jgi:hypothetical protein